MIHEATINQTDTWLTPPALLRSLGEFDLDPCAAPNQPWPTAKKHYALPEDNGLLLPWYGRVWCNPPYGPEAGKFVDRMSIHLYGIMMLFARCETRTFAKVWNCADSLLFIDGRVQFLRPDGTVGREKGSGGPGAPSVLAAFGQDNTEALRRSRIAGNLVTNWERIDVSFEG